jgi:hypothetical protein
MGVGYQDWRVSIEPVEAYESCLDPNAPAR